MSHAGSCRRLTVRKLIAEVFHARANERSLKASGDKTEH